VSWLGVRTSRRRLLSGVKSAAIAAAALAVTRPFLGNGSHVSASAGPAQSTTTQTPIEHFIVLMQENRSFDHYFGKYPGADGIPDDVAMPYDPEDPGLGTVSPFLLNELSDVELADPDHNRDTSLNQYNGGRMDGFVWALTLKNQDGRLAMAYYDDKELPFHWNVADDYVLFDKFFTSAATASFVNHIFWVAGQAGIEDDNIPEEGLDVPVIFDLLEERGITWKFYVQNYDPGITYRTQHLYPPDRASQVIWTPLLAMPRYLDDEKLMEHVVNLDEYFDDLKNGTLPAVAYIAPSGPSEHPPQAPRAGQSFIRSLITELMRSEYWHKAAFMWTYDDWGGWYDHVPPPQVDEYGYGFRAPALIVSPYAKQGHIDSTVTDFTSILRFIEDNWGLPSMAERDAKANSIVGAFDFNQEPRAPKFISAERGVKEKPPSRRTALYFIYGLLVAIPALALSWRAGRGLTRKKSSGNSGDSWR
jgi:phospholipase C